MTLEISTSTDEQDDRVLIVTLDRAARRNAMSDGLVSQLLGLLSELETGVAVRAVVLVGAGAGFCAGSDLAGLAAMDARGKWAFEAASGRLARAITAHPLPILAAVHGFAIGGGLTLAAACDIVVTTAEAKWSLPETPIGLFPAWGLEAVVERIGRPAARRLSWGVDTLDGRTACNWGLADVMAQDPLQEALSIARRLAALPAQQSAAVKDYFAIDSRAEDGDRHANHLFMAACATPEALASFERFGTPKPPK